MENGSQQIDAVARATAIIRLELARRFVPQKPHPSKVGEWWLVEFVKHDMYVYSFERLLIDKPHLEDAIIVWSEANADGRTMLSISELWFKELEHAVLFWMTFR